MAGYTIRSLEEIPDVLGDYPGEMRMTAASDLGTEQVSFTWRRMPPQTGGKGSYMSSVTKRIVGTVFTREVLVSDDANVVGAQGGGNFRCDAVFLRQFDLDLATALGGASPEHDIVQADGKVVLEEERDYISIATTRPPETIARRSHSRCQARGLLYMNAFVRE